MSEPRRREPLRARPAPEPDAAAAPEEPTDRPEARARGNGGSLPRERDVGVGGDGAGRFQRLAEGVRRIRVGGGTLNLSERTLMILGGVIAPLGLAIIFLGWYGAAHTPYLFEQIPYVVSGGLLGIGLVFLGAFFYFAHWLTELVKEHRTQSAAVVEAIARLEEVVRRGAVGATDGRGSAPATAPGETVPLVATPRGTMAHRADCVVVAGKGDLRAVAHADGLLPCKLCDPYSEVLAES